MRDRLSSPKNRPKSQNIAVLSVDRNLGSTSRACYDWARFKALHTSLCAAGFGPSTPVYEPLATRVEARLRT